MKSQHLKIKNRNDVMLAVRLDSPDERPRGHVLFAHCFTCTKNLSAIRKISGALVELGFGVVSFDFTGLGESEGEFADSTFSSNQSDLVDVAQQLAEEGRAPDILVGHSLGGAAALLAAAQIESVRAVATIGAPADPEHVTKLFAESLDEVREKGEATVSIGGRPFRINKQFVDDLERARPAETIAKLRRALLVLHAPQDNTVGIENAAEIFRAARHPKSFIALDGADHLMSRARDARFAATMIATWAERYLEGSAAQEAGSGPEEGHTMVRTGADGYTSEVLTGAHRLLADEPASVGGADRGPAPYDFLLAGLGACTGMTLRMYADRKKWPLTGVTVDLKHERMHAEDCADCETREGKISRIERTVALEGDLDDEQRKRLMEIADRCPVHQTLTGEIRIETRNAQ